MERLQYNHTTIPEIVTKYSNSIFIPLHHLKSVLARFGLFCNYVEQRVIDVSKEHLPNMAESLKDPRVHVKVGDGVEYMKENKGIFDVIITDAPDPIGMYRSGQVFIELRGSGSVRLKIKRSRV